MHYDNVFSCLWFICQPSIASPMAKRPLSVQLRPSSALHSTTGGHDSCWSTRRLSMGDIMMDRQGVSSDVANGVESVRRRPADLSITASCVAAAVPRRRDRCSPSSCKRPIAMTLPRLDLALIQGTIQSGTNMYLKAFWLATCQLRLVYD